MGLRPRARFERAWSSAVIVIVVPQGATQIVKIEKGKVLGPHWVLILQSRIPIFCHLYPEYRFLSQFCISCQDYEESASRVAVEFRIMSMHEFCVFPNLSQILDPDILPPDPGYGGQYILVFQPPPSFFGK